MEKIKKTDELPIQITLIKNLVDFLQENNDVNEIRLQELSQILALLVINYVATSKISEKNEV